MDGKISNLAQVASVRRYVLTEGRGKGLDVIDCDNGKIRFLLNVNKGLDMMQLYHEGQNMSFLCKTAFIAKEDGFLNRFEGGMLYTCGLENAGNRDGYVQHGRFHTLPAEIVRAECTETEIVVEGVVRDSALFGQNLVLRRTYRAKLGDGTVTLEDKLTNAAFTDGEYCLLYHINSGYPMLDDGAKIVLDAEEITPCDDWSKENLYRLYAICQPTAGETETCYYFTLKTPVVSLVNEKLGKKFSVGYSAETLPTFLMWKSFACGDYALGFEPCTSKIGGELKMQPIAAGETKTFSVQFIFENI
jgi:hypothetical protein